MGMIVCEKAANDPKNEVIWYFIVMNSGQRQRIVLEGEHPFDQPTLKNLVGKNCEASGDRLYGKFLAKSIKKI